MGSSDTGATHAGAAHARRCVVIVAGAIVRHRRRGHVVRRPRPARRREHHRVRRRRALRRRSGGRALHGVRQANTIERHGLEASDGLTYAELEQDDPRRETVMTASFLRASLFTSVVAFGVAVFAFGIGLVLILIGVALLRIHRRLEGPPQLS